MLLGIDIGTTHCKAGVVSTDGRVIHVANRPMRVRHSPEGFAYYDADEVWENVATVIREATEYAQGKIAAVGIASMAETGLLLDLKTGRPRSFFVPWFDSAAEPQAERIRQSIHPLERFSKTGLRSNYKTAFAKILWLHARDENSTRNAVWLSTADYTAYRLTGVRATDFSLAVRTFAFRLHERRWDEEWIREFGMQPELFPDALASIVPVGKIQTNEFETLGLPRGVSVSIAGHDHVCAAIAMGILQSGIVLDSMGTAESLMGIFKERALGQAEYDSGLVFGCYPLEGYLYWMGGLSASGGSLEWLRAILGEPALSYDELLSVLQANDALPTGILYFPYLLGTSSSAPGKKTRGAILGLKQSHTRADLLNAAMEGTAYEVETLRRNAERVLNTRVVKTIAAGGGTRNARWLQIKADVSGNAYHISAVSEATVLGAALLAGIGCGIYENIHAASDAVRENFSGTIVPDAARQSQYAQLYEQDYLPAREWLLGKRK